MQLDRHLERLHDRLALVTDGEREEEARAAQRLIASLDDSVRLMLLDVLAAAAAEITRELAPTAVELRLRGGEPEFVVNTAAPGHGPDAGDGAGAGDTPTVDTATGGEGAVARINLRLPEQLKGRVEQAAEQEGLSTNAWLVRAASAALERSGGRSEQGPSYGGQSYKGWGR